MKNPNPLVSIICLAFNHRDYIDGAIKSALAQEYENTEILIIDDYSSDETFALAEKYVGPKVRIWRNTYNKGVSESLNFGIKQAQGDIICFLATDDTIEKHHLKMVVDEFNAKKNIAAVYARFRIIDEDGFIHGEYSPPKLDRFQMLESMYLEGNNYLPAPGSCFLKNVFPQVGFFNPSLIQTQDFDLNIRVLLLWDFSILEEPTVCYRRISGDKNLSASVRWVRAAFQTEFPLLMETFCKFCSREMYLSVFGNDIRIGALENELDLEFALAQKAIESGSEQSMDWGFRKLTMLLSPPGAFDYFYTKFSFSFDRYIGLYKQKSIITAKTKKPLLIRAWRRLRKLARLLKH